MGMKLMKSVLVVVISFLLLSACTVSGPSVKMKPYEVKVEPVSKDGGAGPGPSHCPPGHAKKNWC